MDEQVPTVMLDKKAVVRIITNLIQNSLRYANQYVKIALAKEDNQIKLTFSNDTIMLTPSHIKQIFRRTYTADHSRSDGGTGIGLSITKQLVELQEGNIKAELIQDVFYITIMWNIGIEE